MRLALETATDRASVAVGSSETDAVEANVSGARRHAGALLSMIASVLERANVRLEDVTMVIVSDGPGSFTGLRVGAAVAKGLVRSGRATLWSAPSLMVRAAGVSRRDGTVLAVADALRGEVYAAAYRLTDTAVIAELAPMVCRPDDLMRRLSSPIAIVGEVPPAAREALERWTGQPMITPPAGAPDARHLLGLADRSGGAQSIADPSGWEPVYGRPAEAQARWEHMHGRPLPDPAGSPR
jgi:tRNA threonylcarbamoyladenosine biosynthesis protein TsaB